MTDDVNIDFRTVANQTIKQITALDDVAGLGPNTRKLLLRHLGSLKAIQAASDEALLAVPGVSPRHVKALRKVYPAKPTPLTTK